MCEGSKSDDYDVVVVVLLFIEFVIGEDKLGEVKNIFCLFIEVEIVKVFEVIFFGLVMDLVKFDVLVFIVVVFLVEFCVLLLFMFGNVK